MSRTVPGGNASVGVISGFSDMIVSICNRGDGVVRDGSLLDDYVLQPIYVSSCPVSYCGPTLDRQRIGGTTISYAHVIIGCYPAPYLLPLGFRVRYCKYYCSQFHVDKLG